MRDIALPAPIGVTPEMENRCSESGARRRPSTKPSAQVLERPDAAARDDGDGHRVRHARDELEVVARLGAVAVHAREQDLAGAETRGLDCPRDGVLAGRRASAVDEHLPAVPSAFVFASIATTIACAPHAPAHRCDELRLLTAAVLMLTLSAPAASSARTSSSLRTPPPTVSGTNVASAVRATTSSSVPRPSCDAVMSSSAISSAPVRVVARAPARRDRPRRADRRSPRPSRRARLSRRGTG